MFTIFLPAFLWALAVANGIAFAWTQSGTAFYAVLSTVLAFAVGSAFLAPQVAAAINERTSTAAKIFVYGMAVIGTFAATAHLFPRGWMRGDGVADVPPESPIPSSPVGASVEPILPPGPKRTESVPANVLDLIPAAQEMLRGQRLDVERCGGSGTDMARCLCDYKLAVSDPSGNVTLVEAYQDRPSTPPGYSVSVLEYEKKYERACGTNPVLDVSHPPGQTVLAIRTVVKTTGGNTRPAVFTPFTDDLNIPELRERGLDYWWRTVLEGRDQLVAARVPSLQRKDELVTDAIPAMTVFMLGIVENIGSDYAFGPRGSDLERLRELDAVLVMFGANGAESFASRVSAAKAAGVLQIVDTTARKPADDVYTKLRTWYAGANIPGYQETVLDHRASVRYAFVHLDEELRSLTRDERRDLPKQLLPFGLYSAAGYNGSAKRAARVMRGCAPESWVVGSCGGLHPEAANYVRRYLGTYPALTSQAVVKQLQDALDGVVPRAEEETQTE